MSDQNLQQTCNQLATDTISRQTAIDAIMGQPPEPHYPSWYAEQIKALPPAEPEIIHCLDCKHWREGGVYSYCQKLFDCGVVDVHDYMRAEDDFCSKAERREEGGE